MAPTSREAASGLLFRILHSRLCGRSEATQGRATFTNVVPTGLLGLGIGNATSLPPLIAQVEFGSADALRVVALAVAIAQGAYASAPATFGLLRELGSDDAIFGLAAIIQVAAAGTCLIGRGTRGSCP